jgi:negative regulator of sigma E activity
MSEKHAEDMCAFLDGELDDAQARFLISRLNHDQELAARWQRCHTIRAVLRKERRHALRGFSERVSMAVALESAPAEDSHSQPASVRWLRPAAGMAIAASVALVAFNALQQPMDPAPEAPGPTLASVDQTAVPPSHVVDQRATVASGATSPGRAWDNPRLQRYLLQHNENAAPRTSSGLVPYVYLISTPPPAEEADKSQVDEPPVDESVPSSQ